MVSVDPFGLPFDEAIRFLRDKTAIPTLAWNDLWQHEHDAGFMVAKATSLALIEDFRDTLAAAIEAGTTLADFRRDFERIVTAHGWTGWTGEGSAAGRAWRARVIYDTNLRTARAAGRWEQIQRTKADRPWLRYVATLDNRTRPDHRHWHGTILPADHLFWQTHCPPNGWYCRCTIQQLSDRDLERRGWEPTADPDSSTDGIDPGFTYAPGRAGQREALAAALRSRADALGITVP